MRVRGKTNPVDPEPRGRWLCPGLLSMLFCSALFAAPDTPVYSITDFVTCESARTNAPHDRHVPQTLFRTDADQFFAWVELRDVSGVHPVTMKLYQPDGTYYGEETQSIHETNGVAAWWRMVAWWRVRGWGISQNTGRWKLDLLIDGALLRSVLFDITPGNPVGVTDRPPESADSVPEGQTSANRPVAEQELGVCMIEVSSDLVHWTTLQTYALPTGVLQDLRGAKGGFRLTLGGCDLGNCTLEISPDSLSWIPVQTNSLLRARPLDSSDTDPVTTQFYRAAIP